MRRARPAHFLPIYHHHLSPLSTSNIIHLWINDLGHWSRRSQRLTPLVRTKIKGYYWHTQRYFFTTTLLLLNHLIQLSSQYTTLLLDEEFRTRDEIGFRTSFIQYVFLFPRKILSSMSLDLISIYAFELKSFITW